MRMGKVDYDLSQGLIRIPQRYLWISDNTILSQQRGVFRVNCIDCLDRTNVVQVSIFRRVRLVPYEHPLQSAFARHILNKQLGAVALLNPQEEGRTETDLVVNDGEWPLTTNDTRWNDASTVWANNGDAISRE